MNVRLQVFLKENGFIGRLTYKNHKYTDNYFITNEKINDDEFLMNKENGKYTLLDKHNNYLCGGYLSDKDVNGITFPVSTKRDMKYFNKMYQKKGHTCFRPFK